MKISAEPQIQYFLTWLNLTQRNGGHVCLLKPESRPVRKTGATAITGPKWTPPSVLLPRMAAAVKSPPPGLVPCVTERKRHYTQSNAQLTGQHCRLDNFGLLSRSRRPFECGQNWHPASCFSCCRRQPLLSSCCNKTGIAKL